MFFPEAIFSGSVTYHSTMSVLFTFVADYDWKWAWVRWDYETVLPCLPSVTRRGTVKRFNQHHSHEFSLLQHNRRGKMCKHKHALKGKMIRGVQKRSSPDPSLIPIQLFLSAGKQSSLFISHMAWPPVLLTQEREMLRKPCEDMSRGPVWEIFSCGQTPPMTVI